MIVLTIILGTVPVALPAAQIQRLSLDKSTSARAGSVEWLLGVGPSDAKVPELEDFLKLVSSRGLTRTSLSSADLNGDGVRDLIQVFEEGSGASWLSVSLAVHRRARIAPARANSRHEAATTPFALASVTPFNEPIPILRSGDFDADGLVDLALAREGELEISFLMGDGQGSFLEPRILPLTAPLRFLVDGPPLRPDAAAVLIAGLDDPERTSILIQSSRGIGLDNTGAGFVITQGNSTLTVNTGDDPVDEQGSPTDLICTDQRCTLRAAVLAANQTPGVDTIQFGVSSVMLNLTFNAGGAELDVTDVLVVDGGGVTIGNGDEAFFNSGVFTIRLDGASGSTIRNVNFSTDRAAFGIDALQGANSITVEGNTFAESTGIRFQDSSGGSITGNSFQSPGMAVLIKGMSSGTGILNNQVEGSSLGFQIENTATGLAITGNTLSESGIDISQDGFSQEQFEGAIDILDNRLGVSAEGTASGSGGRLRVHNSTGNLIASNLLAGAGLVLSTAGTEVTGNLIGTNAEGAALGVDNGIQISGDDNEVTGNAVAFATSSGIQVTSAFGGNVHERNRISQNSIHDNEDRGIQLGSFREPNDDLDADTGPNQLQNFPELEAVPGTLNLAGNLRSQASQSYTIEIFSNTKCDPLLEGETEPFGEGETFLDSFPVETDASGFAEFVIADVSAGFFTATATDSEGNTSEFSNCVEINGEQPVESFVVNSAFDLPDSNVQDGNYDGLCSTGVVLDSGDPECSLRAALQEANFREGHDRISFAISGEQPQGGGEVHIIRPQSELPRIQDPITIDGYTQLGSARASQDAVATILIELDGSDAGSESHGLAVLADGSRIEGLSIHSFRKSGIVLASDNNVVAGNHLGADASGLLGPGNGEFGLVIDLHSGNCVGGDFNSEDQCVATIETANVISGNLAAGLVIGGINATGNTITGNLIGVDASGRQRLPNGSAEEGETAGVVLIRTGGHQIGPSNVISGNDGFGILLQNTAGIRVLGNWIGVDANYLPGLQSEGTLGNLGAGIQINSSGAAAVGGRNPDDGNVIGFTRKREMAGSNGIVISKSGAIEIIGNQIFKNLAGISFVNGHQSLVESNSIHGHSSGVLVDSDSERISILSNEIYDNLSGIFLVDADQPCQPGDFGNDGDIDYSPGNLCDQDDLDEGANNLQNVPLLYQASLSPSTETAGENQQIRIAGVIRGPSSQDYLVQFFETTMEDLNPQGHNLLGSIAVDSSAFVDGWYFFNTSMPVDSLMVDRMLTATATDGEGNTSAFSATTAVRLDGDGDGVPADLDPDDTDPSVVAWDQPGGSPLRLTAAGTSRLVLLQVAYFVFGFRSGATEDFAFPAGLAESLVELEGSTPQGSTPGTAVLTLERADGFPVDSYYNFGPSPENPENHYYEFLFDGTTGAEILEDKILVHLVDGARGDHDLSVNGQILTRGGPVQFVSSFYFPQVGDGLLSDIRFRSGLAFLNAGSSTPVEIDLRNSFGIPLPLMFTGLGFDSRLRFGMTGGAVRNASSVGESPIQVGYAAVRAARPFGGTAVFSRTNAPSDVLLFETGVPATTPLSDFTVFFDSLGNRDTGLAIVYPSKTIEAPDAVLTFHLYDEKFVQLGSTEQTLSPKQHQALFITQLFPNLPGITEMQGTLTVESDQPLAAVTLRQNDIPGVEFPDEVPTLAAFPVIPGRADGIVAAGAQEPKTFFFPQVGDGVAGNIRFQTGIILVNAGGATEVDLEFFDSSGGSLSLDLGGLGTGSSFNFAMSQGEAVVFETSGTGNIQVGYARVTAGGAVGGTAVFTRSNTDTGILLYEAGVAASEALTDFSLVVDTRENRDIGLALVNPPPEVAAAGPAEVAHVVMRLYDQAFELLAENELELPPGQHLPRFVGQFFPEAAELVSEMQGSITVASDVPLAAVTLRQNDDPVKVFPEDVPTLTTFPVIPGRADPDPARPECFLQNEIEDPELETAIRSALSVAEGPIPCDTARLLTFLNITNQGVASLAGLEQFEKLAYLAADQNPIFDLTPLADLEQLQVLLLSATLVNDVSPLADLDKLEYLSISDTAVDDLSPLVGIASLEALVIQNIATGDLSPLAALTGLEQLRASGNGISNISALAGMTQLRVLNLSSNPIGDLSALAELVHLQELFLFDSKVSSIAPLAGLTALAHLNLGINQITDISPLSGLENLERLYVGANSFSDISPLSNLTSLQRLTLENNQISDISALAGLVALVELRLDQNQISNLDALIQNSGIDQGDEVNVRANPLDGGDCPAILALLGRGVILRHDLSCSQ